MRKLLVLADDFTGGLDTGAQFAAAGIPTVVTTNPAYCAADHEEDTVLVVDVETRHLLPEKARLSIAGNLSGVRHYSEMPLKILKAEQLVGGEAAMDQILHDLFNREIDPMYPYLTYQDFLDACSLTEEELNLD